MMTNRPLANRSRWITGIAVCASAVGLAALLGAAMTPSPAVPAATAVLAPTEQENYVARRVADIVIDHGLQKFHRYRSSSTLLDVESCDVVRFGSCYEDIAYVLRRHFRVELPPRTAP